MASNKKAQILAAVMCASSIFGSYTVVSAADATANVDKVNGKITATAKNNDNQQSTITLQGNNFSVSVGGAATSSLALKDGTFTLNSKNLKIDSNNGLRIYDGTNTSPTATITKAGVITGTGLNITSVNSRDSAQNAKSTVSYNQVQDFVTNGAYKTTSTVGINGVTDSIEKMNGGELENKVSSTLNASGLTTTVQSKGAEAGIENINSTKNKTISQVAYNSVTDTVYDANGKRTSYSNVGTTSIADTIYASNGSTTLASSNISKSVSETTESGSVALTANKITTSEGKTTTLTSKLNLTGDSATLTSGSASVTLNNTTGNVAITANQKGSQGYVTLSGKNVKLDSNGLNIYDGTSTTPTATISKTGAITGKAITGTGLKIDGKNTGTGLTVDGAATSSIISRNPGNWDEYTKSQVAYNGVTDTVYDSDGRTVLASSSISKSGKTGKITLTTNKYDDNTNLGEKIASSSLTLDGENVLFSGKNASLTSTGLTVNGTSSTNPDAKSTSIVAYNAITDTVTNGTYKTTSTVGATGVTDTVTNASNQTLAQSQVNTAGITLTANKYDEENTKTSSSLSIKGDSATLTSGTAYVKVDNTLGNVTLSGNNATLSGSTFTLKDTTNGKTLASLGASGLSINNADGIKVGGISNTGYLMANDGMNVTDKNSSWVTIGTSTMQKDITATTTTSYAGITNKIDTTLAGNKTYTSGTVVGPTSVTTTVQGSNTTDAISGNKNKTTSTVSATGVTDTVYNVKGNQVASSSVTTNGIVNTTTNLSIDGSTNNTMSTSIYQDKRGISASATKKDENGTVGTSTLTLAGNSASLKVGNYGFAVDSNNNVSIAGNNATLSGSTFTLKDGSNNTARLTATGLTFTDASGQPIGGVSSTGAITGTSLNITAKNTAGNKTTSTVGATGVTDRVYDTDGKTQVAYSSVGTGGISNTTSLKTTTGKIDTAINQNTSGVGISSTKYDTNNNVTDKTSLTMNGSANNITSIKYNDSNKTAETTSVSVNGGTSSITSYGNYVYGEDGKATSYNQASMSLNGNTGTATIRGGSNTASSTLTLNEAGVGLYGKNVSLTSTDLTLKNVETGKAYVKIGSNGLNIYNDEGTSVFGVTRTGAINIDKNVTIDDSYTKDGYTYTASNSISGSNGISNVATKKDESGKTIATNRSTVTTSGITNSTNISGIAIKDDEYNTKTMSTSIAQNANGVSISSNKYNVYNDGTNTVQTTDGTSTISVNGAKTTISGSGYKYEKDENGKLVVSSRNSASLSVDGESGIISLSGKNVGLNAGGLNVNGTGTTTIKSTNATTGAMGQSQLSYNGVTDTVTNAAGNKTTSTVNATGTIDQVYDVDGKTRIAYSNVTTSGITDSFTKDGITNSVTTNANGTTFASTGNGSTTIKGGAITTNSITVAGNTIDDEFFEDIGHTSGKTEGIDRYGDDNVGYTTSIETTFKVHSLGTGSVDIFGSKIESTLNGQTTVINGGSITTNSLTVGNVSFGDLVNRVDVLEDKTQNITPSNPGTGEGGSVVPPTIDGQTGINGDVTVGGDLSVGGNLTADSATIGGVTMKDNTVTATTGNFDNVAVGGTEGTSISKDGVTVGDKKSDNYTSITNNDVVVNNNGNKTSLTDVGNRVSGLESSVSSMNNRLSDVEDRIDKVGAMSAAIANLRTMGYDPEAPTEIAIGVGQYKSETGLALGVFHYPNQDFMLSASISTSGDEVMGGIGATWKLGRKSAAEKAKDEEARRLEKAEEMKKLAQDAKVKAQAERHAKLLAEREAQKTA